MYNPRKKVNKIFGQINKIAQKGKDNNLEYQKLIDDIIKKGDYSHLEICLAELYNIDPTKYKTVDDLKKSTWKNIMFDTDSAFITGLKKLYKSNNVYQQGNEIRSDKGNFTILNVKGGTEHYPFKEEKVQIQEKWNKVTKSKYTQVQGRSQISISKSPEKDTIQIQLHDPKIYQIDIAKVIWATYSLASGIDPNTIIEAAVELNLTDTIQAFGTQSYLDPAVIYKTKIPTTHGADYLIKVKRRGNPGWISSELRMETYGYKVYIRKENLLGTIKEFDYQPPSSDFHYLNQNFAKATGIKKTFLEVKKNGAAEPITIVYDNEYASEDKNLLQRYTIAINYLNS